MAAREGIQIRNWEGRIASFPTVVTFPRNVDDLICIMKDTDKYPAPVRAVGSNHSTTRCATADGGTIVHMSNINRILEIGPDFVTAEAGALYIDVAHELLKHNLQFYVNVELGNLTIGSAACGGTKDASMPGEFGQVCSYATAIKLVTPAGDLLEVTEDQPDLLQVMRSSYGLFGIIYEVTFSVKPMRYMTVEHKTYQLDEFEKAFPRLITRQDSGMLYLFPFLDAVSVEFRKNSAGQGTPNRFLWKFRNNVWKTVAPGFGYIVTNYIPLKTLRYKLVDRFNQLMQFIVHWFLKDKNTIPTDQIIRYPKKSNWTRYTFSIWAFAQDRYLRILREYFRFCRDYYHASGYRCNMLNVGYRINEDKGSLFSYSFDGPFFTLDPVSTGDTGWENFLLAYNDFCSRNGGVPLFNQTRGITPDQAKRAFGQRLETFQAYRRQFDPTDRLLNQYFREVLQPSSSQTVQLQNS